MWLKSCTYLCLFYTNSDTVLSPRREPEYCIEFHSKPSSSLHVSESAVKLEDHWGVYSEHPPCHLPCRPRAVPLL